MFSRRPTEKFVCGAALCLLMMLFHWSYMRSVIPPQTGWWQYYGWRLSQGDLLYKDIYCYLQPYYPWLMGLLYRVLGNQFMLYTLVGMVIRITGTVFLYIILTRHVKPMLAMLAVFTGSCVNASYLMDQAFDYNPIITFLVFLQALVLLKIYESDSAWKTRLWCLLSGLLSGVHFMMKQTTGLTVPLAVLVALLFILRRQQHSQKSSCSVGGGVVILLSGFFVAVAPGLTYLLYTGSFSAYLFCVFNALSAKGDLSNIWSNIVGMIVSRDILITFAIVLFAVAYPAARAMYFRAWSRRWLWKCLAIVVVVVSIGMFAFFGQQRFASLWANKSVFMGPVRISCLFLAAVMPFLFLWWDQRCPNRDHKAHLGAWILFTAFALILLAWPHVKASLHEDIYYKTDFFSNKRFLCMINFYAFSLIWVIQAIAYIASGRNEARYANIAGFLPVFALMVTSLMSAIIEELYMLPVISFVLAFILRVKFTKKTLTLLKNAAVISFCGIMCLISLSQKLLIPYAWHGWTEPSVLTDTEHRKPSEVNGLWGFSLEPATEKMYEEIVGLIERYTTPKDVVYQFPHIPLFNVLTERKTAGYMPIQYFDVCPDEIVQKDVAGLYDNPPAMMIYDNLGEGSWEVNERVFRGGKRSGQRDVQTFYETYVQNQYTQMASYDNHYGGTIEIWVRNDRLVVDEDMPSGQSQILCKLGKRGKTRFLVARRMRREAGLCLPALTAR